MDQISLEDRRTPEKQPRKPSTTKGVLTRMFVTIGLGLIVLGLWNVPKLLQKPEALQEASALTADDFQDGGSYDLGETVILDSFAYGSTDDNVTTNYYAVAFGGKGDKALVITLAVATDDDIHQTLENYLNDSTQQMGDLTMDSICGVAQDYESDDLKGFYEEYIDSLMDQGFTFDSVPVELIYKGSGPDSFQQRVDDEHCSLLYTSAIYVILGIIFLAVGLLLKKRGQKSGQDCPNYRRDDDDGPRMNGPEIL